jgi:hypothetical protein
MNVLINNLNELICINKLNQNIGFTPRSIKYLKLDLSTLEDIYEHYK